MFMGPGGSKLVWSNSITKPMPLMDCHPINDHTERIQVQEDWMFNSEAPVRVGQGQNCEGREAKKSEDIIQMGERRYGHIGEAAKTGKIHRQGSKVQETRSYTERP